MTGKQFSKMGSKNEVVGSLLGTKRTGGKVIALQLKKLVLSKRCEARNVLRLI